MLLRRVPSLPSWPSSFRDLDEARREIERLFGAVGQATGAARTAGVYPAINVSEDANSVYVRAELPGVDAKNLNVSIEKDTLTIAGERLMSPDDDDVSYHRREREWGAFRRSLSLPTRVESENIQARYADGILKVTVPKAAEARPRQITIQAQT